MMNLKGLASTTDVLEIRLLQLRRNVSYISCRAANRVGEEVLRGTDAA